MIELQISPTPRYVYFSYYLYDVKIACNRKWQFSLMLMFAVITCNTHFGAIRMTSLST